MTPQQRDALKQALEQHSLSMAVKDAAPEDVAALPQDFAVPTYNANNQPLYDNQLFPAVNSAEDLVARGYATPDGQVTENGQMALSLKKVGALNDDYTLNDTGKTLMASRDDLLKEENIDLYREYKRLELDEAPDVGIWDSIKDIASKTVQGANVIAENELGGIKDIASSQIFGGAFDQYGAEALTPEKRAESRITTEEAAKDLFVSSAGLARAAATEIDKVAAKTMWDGMMQDYQVSYLEQKYDRDLADMEKVNTAEVADELAKVIGLETQFAEGRQQAEQLIGPEATQQAIEGGRAAGLTLSIVNPLAPEALAARAGFSVAQKGVTAAFKPIARKLLESENKAAQALAANQRVNGLNSHLAQTQYLAKSAEDQAVFAERQADKLSKMGIVDRANSARTLADNLRTKGLEAGARAQGLTDEIARASDEAAKLAQDAAVADKINFVAQRARELPGMPLQAIGGLIEGTGKAMIGIDKGLSTLASKIGADKAWNAMNRISSLSGLGGAGAVMGLGPAAFVPAAIRTAWSTAPFLKGAGHFVRMIGKETANARELIPFWQRVANYETLGATQRSIAHLMDTSTLGSRVTGLAGDVAKGMAAAYPVDLAFQWISDGGEMDMNTLKQAAAETVVFGGTGAALGGITAASTDRIKKLQRGSALNFYRNIKDGGQRVAFNALNDGMKRSIGTYASSFPNLNVRFTDQGGGAFDKATNTAFINPMARNPLKPLLAHEINHYILVRNQMEGGVAAALVGDGVQTGGILRGKDGKLDENFQAFKDEYTRRLESQHNRQVDTRIAAGEKIPARERTFTPPTDNDMAIEYFVDSMADDMMGMAESGELGKQAGRMLVTRKMQSLGNAILQQAPIIKDFFYKLGGATDKNGRAVYGNGLLAEGIREIPEMKKLFRKMISESAGRPMHVAKVTKGESDGHAIPIMGKDDPILNEMISLWETNADGVPLRDKNGDYIPLSDQTEQLRASSGLMLLEDQQNRINRGETLEQGELRFNPEENAWTGEYLTDRQIQILRTSGRFNNAQLRQLDMLNGAAKENTGRRFLVFNQPTTKKRKGKRVAYDTLGVSMREIVPYGIKITKDGNLLVRLMSVQQLHANAFEKAASKRGQTLYKGNAEQILNDVNQVIENHGRNEPTDAYFKSRYGNEWEVRKNFINTVFGNVGKGQKDINPLLAAEKAKNAVVKTYRIDRINKATELEGRTNLPYQNHLVKVNFMPEGEPILDENGEPKDLRYTPSYEDSQVRMPEAQRAMPEVSPEDLNPVANKQEAQGLWADGKRMFALNEMDEKLTPITSKAMLDSYSADAIGWIEPQAQNRFMPEKLDSDYMKAVESGDVESQQRLVDEVAKRAGYDSENIAYHGTNVDFNNFDVSDKIGVWTGSESVASLFSRIKSSREGGTPRVIKAYLKAQNPATVGYDVSVSGDKAAKQREKLISEGYDSIESKGNFKIVFDPSQVKSADPITRDDSGNVIPLSKRFDVGSRDMRFMPEGDGSINLMKQTNLGGDASMIMSAKWGTPKQTSQSVALSDKPENHIVGLSRIKGLLKAKDLSDKQKSSLEDFLVKTASFATDSPGFRDLGTPTNKEEALTIISKVTDRMARNLLSIYDAVPPPIRSYWQRWYPLAYDWNKAQSSKHKITRQVVAGINARLSPGKDWIHNVNMTERILSSFADDISMTQEIADGAMPIIDNALETKLNSKENKNKPKAWIDEQKAKVNAAKQEVQNLVGMKLSEMTDAQAAQLIRYHTQVVGDNKVLNYFEQGNPVYADAISWQSFSNLEKAINMYRDPSMENISNNMGSDHKIRSFFNNQESPNDNVLRDVTSDTHAVAAAYLLPLSQSSQQVARNFGGSSNAVSGLNGMYYIVADAYRKAADARNVEPRAMQSITWEGARSMFPRGFKKAENVKKVEAIWNRFEKRELTKQQALQEINKLLIDFFAKNPNSRPRFAVLPR
jgi:hypothetical protein